MLRMRRHLSPAPLFLNRERVMPVEKGTTPVKLEKMLPFLSRYPDRVVAGLLEAGFKEGFRIRSAVREVSPHLWEFTLSAFTSGGGVGQAV